MIQLSSAVGACPAPPLSMGWWQPVLGGTGRPGVRWGSRGLRTGGLHGSVSRSSFLSTQTWLWVGAGLSHCLPWGAVHSLLPAGTGQAPLQSLPRDRGCCGRRGMTPGAPAGCGGKGQSWGPLGAHSRACPDLRLSLPVMGTQAMRQTGPVACGLLGRGRGPPRPCWAAL